MVGLFPSPGLSNVGVGEEGAAELVEHVGQLALVVASTLSGAKL
jgi:hypothetical protein